VDFHPCAFSLTSFPFLICSTKYFTSSLLLWLKLGNAYICSCSCMPGIQCHQPLPRALSILIQHMYMLCFFLLISPISSLIRRNLLGCCVNNSPSKSLRGWIVACPEFRSMYVLNGIAIPLFRKMIPHACMTLVSEAFGNNRVLTVAHIRELNMSTPTPGCQVFDERKLKEGLSTLSKKKSRVRAD
jgi:hypothetical protein